MSKPIDRRGFLQVGAGAAALTSLAGGVPRAFAQENAEAENGRKLKKAVNLGMVTGNATVLDKLKLLKEHGFDGIEINRPGGPPVDEVNDACKATGMVVGNVVDSVHWDKPLSDANAEIRAQGLEGLRAALRESKALGCATVLLVPAVVTKQVTYAEAYTRSQIEIRKALPLAAELGVKIAIENVWNQFLLSPLEAARYVDEFNSAAVAWHFDVGNIVNYGWPEQWIRILGQRIVNLHIKEYSRQRRDKEGLWKGFEAELLEGDCDWPAVMKALDEIGYNGWAVAEIPGGDASRMKAISERMNRILAA